MRGADDAPRRPPSFLSIQNLDATSSGADGGKLSPRYFVGLNQRPQSAGGKNPIHPWVPPESTQLRQLKTRTLIFLPISSAIQTQDRVRLNRAKQCPGDLP
jgi:hypothetical protein